MTKSTKICICLFLIIYASVARGYEVTYAKTDDFRNTDSIDLPIKPGTLFYLTATPKNHSTDGNRSAVDIQIVNNLGFVEKGIPLYSPIDGHATYIKSPNGSGVIEILSQNKEWKAVIAHIANDLQISKSLISTYPKHVIKGELIAYQGDSGYFPDGRKFPVHVHYEVFMLKEGRYVNDDSQIDICSKIKLSDHCRYVDESGYVVFVNDK